jgi:ADP-ribosylglycohydrolase
MDRQDYANRSLLGLQVGDSIGNMSTLYYLHDILALMDKVPFSGSLRWSDDTEEAVVLYEHIIHNRAYGNGHSVLDQDKLAQEFAERFMRDSTGDKFGYGPRTRDLFRRIHRTVNNIPEHWSFVSKEINSFGNGSAMRVAPLGPLCGMYEKDMDMDMLHLPYVKERAYLQAEVTHEHIEGKSGAVAVALASTTAVWLARLNESGKTYLCEGDEGYDDKQIWQEVSCSNFFDSTYGKMLKSEIICNPLWSMGRSWTYEHKRDVSQTEVREGLKVAASIPFETPIGKVVEKLGNGRHVTCQDTVPFALWCAAKNINNYRQALIDCSLAGGDVDTTSAIVGGIVGIVDPPPQEWVDMCQPLDVKWRK